MSKRKTINVDLEVWELLNDYFNVNAEYSPRELMHWLIEQGASYKAMLLMGYPDSDIDVLTDDQIDVLLKLAHKTKMDCWFGITDSREIIDYEDYRILDTREALEMFNDGVEAYPLDYDYYELTQEEQEVYRTIIAKWMPGKYKNGNTNAAY